jgi:hypothetical protein
MASSAYDQISTIINRLEQLADVLNPVSLAEAIGQAISIVSSPLPGDAGELRTLAGAFTTAARDSTPIGGDLHTMANQKLPDVWRGDVAVTASQVVNDAGDLVQQLPPAFTTAATAIDDYAGTLTELEARRADLLQQLYNASHSVPNVDVFGIDIPLDPAEWSAWIDAIRNLIYGSIDLYNDLQDAADILAGQFADVQAKAGAGMAVKAGMNLTDAVVLAATTVDGSSLLGSGQLTRLAGIMAAMSPAERARLDAVLGQASSPLAQAYILKALAAGNSLGQVTTFAGLIHGQSPSWLIDHLSLGGTPGELSYDGVPLIQSTQTECGSASIVAAQVLSDPIFALHLTTGANGAPLSGQQFAAQVAANDQATHDFTNTVSPWPQSLGTSPWGVAAGMNGGAAGGVGNPAGTAGYGVDWVDDTDPRSSYPALQQAISAVDAGYPVPILLAPTLGNLGNGMHYVLITGHSGNQLSIYDPEGGTITQVPESDFLNGDMQAYDSGSPHVNAVIVPGG